MTMKDDEEYGNLDVKIKFFGLTNSDEDRDEDEEFRYRLKFVKKRGDLAQWYQLLEDIKETWLEGMLMSPQQNNEFENLATVEKISEEVF